MFKLFKYLKWIDYLYLFFILCLVVLQVYLDLELPNYMANIIEYLQTPNMPNRVNEILVNGGYMLACAVGSLLSAVIVNFFVVKISARLSANLRFALYGKIESFSLTELNKFSTASLITRTTNDINNIQMLLAMGTQSLIKAPIMAVWAIVTIVGKGWEWSVATAGAVVALIIVTLIVFFFAVPKFKKIQTLTDNLNRVTRENLTGIRVIRASNAEKYQNDKFDECNSALTKNNLSANRIMAIMNPGMSLIMTGLTLAIYWIGAYIVEDAVDIANMMVFTSYAMQVVMAFMLLIIIFILLPRSLVSARRINEVLSTHNSIISGDFKDEKFYDEAVGSDDYVVFKNVSFKYADANEYVLKNISFSVKKGETVAFIGSTGSGKSTLINLIPRLYDATEGEVLIDGVNVKDYDCKTLNKKIGYTPQRGVLFSGTVKSNVDFGDNNADEETIRNSLKIAQASNFVSKMEGGIEARIAQGGTNVSGGQKQRLSIARAIARKPDIFIFDDSFSALDFKTDRRLRTALKKHTEGTTQFIVAQRIGTIKDADKIIVLDSGNMVGIGTHEELLKNCPIYKEIALSQLSEEELQ
ncbi:MAG TPA: ABC transporter ATP-binding protein [Candidatus Caccovivens faecavium]|nr:ABC transporter ATP-binding protein [Candidatus Caccovivens faecavium]